MSLWKNPLSAPVGGIFVAHSVAFSCLDPKPGVIDQLHIKKCLHVHVGREMIHCQLTVELVQNMHTNN